MHNLINLDANDAYHVTIPCIWRPLYAIFSMGKEPASLLHSLSRCGRSRLNYEPQPGQQATTAGARCYTRVTVAGKDQLRRKQKPAAIGTAFSVSRACVGSRWSPCATRTYIPCDILPMLSISSWTIRRLVGYDDDQLSIPTLYLLHPSFPAAR
jgi:hypothetical protein